MIILSISFDFVVSGDHTWRSDALRFTAPSDPDREIDLVRLCWGLSVGNRVVRVSGRG